jgi:hypothetical protein
MFIDLAEVNSRADRLRNSRTLSQKKTLRLHNGIDLVDRSRASGRRQHVDASQKQTQQDCHTQLLPKRMEFLSFWHADIVARLLDELGVKLWLA